MLQLQIYSFELKFRAGHDNPADFLSRHPRPATRGEAAEAEETEAHVRSVVEVARPKAISLGELVETTAKCRCMSKAIKTVESGAWNKFLSDTQHFNKDDKVLMEKLFSIRAELSVTGEGVLLRGERIVVPDVLVPKLLVLAHEGHQGVTKTTARLRQRYWFPRLQEMVADMVNTCLMCAASGRPSPPVQINTPPRSHMPWGDLSVDFCQVSPDHYLFVVLDECTRYPEVELVPNTSAGAVIQALEKIFATHGIPNSIRSDNGPPFRSTEFRSFLGNLNIKLRHVTPCWPQANGDVERFMRTLNKVIRIAKEQKVDWLSEVYRFLRGYRTTPHSSTSVAPGEALMGRKVRDTMPDVPRVSQGHIDHQRVECQRKKRNSDMSISRNSKASNIQVGDSVLLTTRKKSGKLDLTFEARPWKVVEIKSSMITVARANEQVCRNSSFFKRISDTMWKEKSGVSGMHDSDGVDDDMGDILTNVDPPAPMASIPEQTSRSEARVPQSERTPTVSSEPPSQRAIESGRHYNLRRNPAPSSRLKDYYA